VYRADVLIRYRIRQSLWKIKLAIIDASWEFSKSIPRSQVRKNIIFIKIANRYYNRYLSTDDPEFLAHSIENLSKIATDVNSPPACFIEITGWAASPLAKISKIEVRSSLGTQAVKPRQKRPDVAAHFNSQAFLHSGFAISAPIADPDEKVEIRVISKSSSFLILYIDDSTLSLVKNQQESGTSVGSIDSCKKSQNSHFSSLIKATQNSGINLINIAEILIAMNRLEECAELIGLISDVPSGADRRIDRVRFVVEPFLERIDELGHEVLKTRQLDSGRLNRAPKALCVTEEEVLIQSGSLLIDRENRFLVADRAARPEFDFVSAQWEIALGSNARLQEVQIAERQAPTETLKSAVSLLGRNPENYFHSLIEYLPRFFTATDSGLINDHLFLLNSESPPTIKFAAESFIPKSSIRYVSKNDSIQVKELLIPTFHTQTYDSTHIPWEYSGLMDWTPIEKFSRRMIELHLGPEEKYRDFFAVRAGGLRAIPNVKRLMRIAEDEGFEILDLSTLSFVEQLNRMYWSQRMIIPGGAGLAGMIFMQPGASVLTLATAEQKELGTYRAIADHAKVDLNYLLGVSTVAIGEAPFRMNQIHAPFVISPKEFRKAIRTM
jgi:capsular polysaccharide biosynthesis protein